ncbi:MAG: M48 family metalloprotease, partial [Gammaproteobacteria bacterium]|nr:M48 family metalloprotease [Gammaproteobacteria bacterium]
GVFFGRLIQAAVSRQREFLADASSVQFTRDPSGLRNALVKIGRVQGSRIRHPDVEEVGHMLFAPGMMRWFATHPPLLDRIRALDPGFDPASAGDLRLEVKPQPLGVVQVVARDRVPQSFADPDVLRRQFVRVDPGSITGRVGNPGAAEVRRAELLRESLSTLPSAARTDRAVARLIALVLDPQPEYRRMQRQKIAARLGRALADLVVEEAVQIERFPPDRRLPLLAEIVPALRLLPRESRAVLLECLAELCRVDGEIAIFEYALCTLAREYLVEGLDPRRRPRAIRMGSVTAELQTVFSTLAAHGHADAAARETAYWSGMGLLVTDRPGPPYRPVPGWTNALDRALRCLDGLGAADKRQLVAALAAIIVHDGQVTVEEGELLRVICAVLHCPLPPLVEPV